MVTPDLNRIEQGKEYFILSQDGKQEKIRFHDYDRIYEIPGLYEHLFYERYRCNSPEVVCGLLKDQLDGLDSETRPLKVLDIGAGNGMVGEKLVDMGADEVVGVDIIEEAAQALERDRPGIYKDYFVADLTDLPPEVEQSLSEDDFNCMTVVAALGFDDIPPAAFAQGFNFVQSPGWVAFNIKEDFVCESDTSGFCRLIELIDQEGVLEICARRRYRHRFCQDGTPLYYHAVVGKKRQDIPQEMLEAVNPLAVELRQPPTAARFGRRSIFNSHSRNHPIQSSPLPNEAEVH
jgi:SAM-dependent methyltransferase